MSSRDEAGARDAGRPHRANNEQEGTPPTWQWRPSPVATGCGDSDGQGPERPVAQIIPDHRGCSFAPARRTSSIGLSSMVTMSDAGMTHSGRPSDGQELRRLGIQSVGVGIDHCSARTSLRDICATGFRHHSQPHCCSHCSSRSRSAGSAMAEIVILSRSV